MTSITAQQTKLDLELVPKENRLDIGKCNGRIPRGFKPKEETFQVVLDALALTPCYPAFLITVDVPEIYPRVPGREFDALPSKEDTLSFLRDLSHSGVINSLNDVVIDQMHQPCRTFAAIINRSLSGKTSGLDKLRLSRAQILWGMYHQKNVDYIYGAILPKCLTSPEMKESKAYKTYLGYATGEVPPKVARKFKKASPSKKESIVIKEPPVETKSKGKEKEKVDLAHGKGIDLLSEVALTEKYLLKEVRKKSLRDFHKTHPSGSGTVAENLQVLKRSLLLEQENESEKQESDSEQDEESDDDNQEEEKTGKEVVQGEGADVQMNEAQQGNENLETTQEKVVDDAHVTITTVTKKTKVPVTSSSRSSDLASKFLNFLDIPQTDAEIVSPLDVHVHPKVPRTQAHTFLTIHISVIPKSLPVFTNIPPSSQTFTPPPILTTPTHPPTIETTNPLSNLPDFASVFRFNDRIAALEKEVAELKKDPLHTQVISLVDEHLDTRLGETREEFMNLLSKSLTERIKEQVSSQPQSTYEAASTLTEFELKKILLDKMEKSKSYLTAPEHRDCYDGLKKSYALDKDFFYSYDVYSLKRGRKDKDKDEDPSTGSDRGLKRRKTSKDAEPTTEPKKKDSTSGSSKGTKSQSKSSGKSVQSEELMFEVADSDMPQDQEGNVGDNVDEPRKKTASRSDWFKKPTPIQEPTDPDWHAGKTTQEGPPQKWLMTLVASTPTDKSLKDFDELMSTLIDFSSYVLNGLKIENLTQEVLLGPAFRLLKGTRTNYVKLEYDFEDCYKALSEKLDWENPEGDDYPFDLSKPLPLITRGNRQRVPFEFFINNDLKYLQGGVSTMTYTMSTTKAKAAQYDLPGIEDMVPNIWSSVKVAYDRYALWVTHVKVTRKHGYGYLEEIVNQLTNLSRDDVADFAIALRMFTRSLVIQKRVDDLQLGVKNYQKRINVTHPNTTRLDLSKRHPYTP
ncbi:hypothetical protein Tco_0929480 [Tanacetum coccineum]